MPTERMPTCSARPVMPSTVTMSPVLIAFSIWKKIPVITSFTRVCAPKPTAKPNTPAPAMSGPMLMPISVKIIMAVLAKIITAQALLNSDNKVWVRTLGAAPISALK